MLRTKFQIFGCTKQVSRVKNLFYQPNTRYISACEFINANYIYFLCFNEFRSMCTCMNVTPHSFFQDDDYSCSHDSCPGDSGDKCGDKNRIRIFRTRNAGIFHEYKRFNLGKYLLCIYWHKKVVVYS